AQRREFDLVASVKGELHQGDGFTGPRARVVDGDQLVAVRIIHRDLDIDALVDGLRLDVDGVERGAIEGQPRAAARRALHGDFGPRAKCRRLAALRGTDLEAIFAGCLPVVAQYDGVLAAHVGHEVPEPGVLVHVVVTGGQQRTVGPVQLEQQVQPRGQRLRAEVEALPAFNLQADGVIGGWVRHNAANARIDGL